MQSQQRAFLVVVHDIAPPLLGPLRTIGRELNRLVGRAVSGAVVPLWHGGARSDQHAPLVTYLRETVGEVLLHGYRHDTPRPWGLISRLTNGADEFSGLTLEEAARRLRHGRALLEDGLGAPIRGFVPPAWQPGPTTPALLSSCGLEYMLGFWRATLAGRRSRPLAVWSWDCGRIAGAGLASELLGTLRLAVRPDSLPCVVLHPRDVARGYLARALRLIELLLAEGWRPVLPAAYLSAHTGAEVTG